MDVEEKKEGGTPIWPALGPTLTFDPDSRVSVVLSTLATSTSQCTLYHQ
jgi:hypothetical protein